MLKDLRRKTSRAVILPFPGDPFLFQFWYKMFKIWGKEVDKLYIYLNSPIEKDAVDCVRELVKKDKKVVLFYEPNQVEHGEAIKRTLEMVKEDYIMLVEDDCFIWGIGAVSQCFNFIECGRFDIVGSKRGSCGTEILEQAKKKWGLIYEGFGDQGPNFWPNMFFCKKELLLKTSKNFGAKAWKAGDKIKELDNYICTSDQCGDTFVQTSLELRNIVPESQIHYIPQNHGHPEDFDHYQKKTNLFSGHALWCHIGSLSSGIGGLIKDEFDRPLTRRLIDPPGIATKLKNAPTSDFEKKEYERRVQWWDMFYWSASRFGLSDLKLLYKNGIDRIVNQFSLNRKRIAKRKQIYSMLISGDKIT